MAAPTKLGVYRQLSTTAGVHVSPLQLGTMGIGSSAGWGTMFGNTDKDSSFKLLDAYYDAGGNFLDTANNYQEGTSEAFIGEWAEARGIRDQLFIASKYSTMWNAAAAQKAFYIGNSNKSLHLALDASLKRLRTSYIDLYYVHWWDYSTSVEEVMRSLHTLILSRKVLYLGISDAPAWVVAKANQFARDHGLTPFSVYQGKWNVMERDFEKEIIPMARSEGMALAPWGVSGEGKFRTDAEEKKREESGEKGRTATGDWKRNDNQKAISAALEKVAKEVGTEHITAVAIAYVMHKTPFVFPVVGGRKVEHFKANLDALSVSLTKEQIQYLESVVAFNPGFPAWMIGTGDEDHGFMVKYGNVNFAPRVLAKPVSHAE